MGSSNIFRPTGIGSAWWHWIVGGALYGILLRIIFAVLPDSFIEVMSVAFLFGTPFAVGALTIYGIRDKTVSIGLILVAPWATISLMLIGCAVSLLEGSICLAIMWPLFLVFSSLGGVAMKLALTYSGRYRSHLKAVALLPFLIAVGENHIAKPTRELVISKSIEVNAPPSVIWKQIKTARSIRREELGFSLTHLIGVPAPVEGINVQTREGEIRYSKWEKGVNFRARVTAQKENESIGWHYLFDDESFPEGTMDEHVVIGGRYFDVYDTRFNLHKLADGHTRLEVVAHFRVTTGINFYAVPVANLLGGDFVSSLLTLYKGRSEKEVNGGLTTN